MNDSFWQSGEPTDLVKVGDLMLPQDFYFVMIFDVWVNTFFAVFGFESNFRG